MTSFILDGGEQPNGTSRTLKLSTTLDGSCVIVSTPVHGIVAILDKSQQRELVAFVAKQLWVLSDASPQR